MDVQASVIIPTFQDWDGLQICLDCLARQTVDPALFEVIVANNNPDPAVPPMLHLPTNARVIHADKPGSYAARNAAIKVARGDVLFFTDSDCLPDPGWIAAGLDALSTLPPNGIVAGGIELFPSGSEWTPVELYGRIFSLRQDENAARGFCATANMVVRREAFEDFGLFNEDRFSGGDKEWTLDATARGARLLYSPEALIRHPARASFTELAKQYRRMAGGHHDDMVRGRRPMVPLRVYLVLLDPWEVRQIMSYPGLTDRQRMQVVWLCLRIGMVSFAETVRLRYLSGSPRRS